MVFSNLSFSSACSSEFIAIYSVNSAQAAKQSSAEIVSMQKDMAILSAQLLVVGQNAAVSTAPSASGLATHRIGSSAPPVKSGWTHPAYSPYVIAKAIHRSTALYAPSAAPRPLAILRIPFMQNDRRAGGARSR